MSRYDTDDPSTAMPLLQILIQRAGGQVHITEAELVSAQSGFVCEMFDEETKTYTIWFESENQIDN